MLRYIKGPHSILADCLLQLCCQVTPIQITVGKKLIEPAQITMGKKIIELTVVSDTEEKIDTS